MPAQTERAAPAAACVHHWMIESPDGRESRGICRRCGATKQFSNALPNVGWDRQRAVDPDVARFGAAQERSSEVVLADEM